MRVYGSEAVGKNYGMIVEDVKIHIDEENSTEML
jgi:hypothetical protein